MSDKIFTVMLASRLVQPTKFWEVIAISALVDGKRRGAALRRWGKLSGLASRGGQNKIDVFSHPRRALDGLEIDVLIGKKIGEGYLDLRIEAAKFRFDDLELGAEIDAEDLLGLLRQSYGDEDIVRIVQALGKEAMTAFWGSRTMLTPRAIALLKKAIAAEPGIDIRFDGEEEDIPENKLEVEEFDPSLDPFGDPKHRAAEKEPVRSKDWGSW